MHHPQIEATVLRKIDSAFAPCMRDVILRRKEGVPAIVVNIKFTIQ